MRATVGAFGTHRRVSSAFLGRHHRAGSERLWYLVARKVISFQQAMGASPKGLHRHDLPDLILTLAVGAKP